MYIQPDKPAFEFSDDGYFYYCAGAVRKILYGDIVCHALNARFGKPDFYKTGNQKIDRLKEVLSDLSVQAKGSKIKLALGSPLIKNLPKIVTDRKHYTIEYGKLQAIFHSKPVEMQAFWDSNNQKIVQRIYTDDMEDLLLYDIGIVLERNIPICQCACRRYFVGHRWGQKYCPEHRIEGAHKASRENLKNNRCASLHKTIYDRLHRYQSEHMTDVAAAKRLNDYLLAQGKSKKAYQTGEITEEQYYNLLEALNKQYRLRERRKRD